MRVLATLPLLAMAALQVAAGDFSATCSGTSYFSTSVKSYCQDKYQEDNYSTDLDMTKCLANVGGRIVVSLTPRSQSSESPHRWIQTNVIYSQCRPSK